MKTKASKRITGLAILGLMGTLIGCAPSFTPAGVGQQAALYAARKEGAKHSEFIYNIDRNITEAQLYVWHGFRENLLPYTPPTPPLEMEPSPHRPVRLRAKPPPTSPDQLLYRQAMELMKKENYMAAFQKFAQVFRLYPTSDLADNALYWAGECCYVQNLTGEALHFFKRVVKEYPMGNKVPDAMLKMAYIYLHRGQKEKGIKILKELVRNYPQNPVGKKAQIRLIQEEKGLAYY